MGEKKPQKVNTLVATLNNLGPSHLPQVVVCRKKRRCQMNRRLPWLQKLRTCKTVKLYLINIVLATFKMYNQCHNTNLSHHLFCLYYMFYGDKEQVGV